jgi:sec-independent protein translocase protein TatC
MAPMLSVGSYVDFCLKFILAFGAIFELPIAIIFFTRVGLVTPEKLAKHREYAILLAFIAAAILTPTPDVFNQTLMAVPMIVLYEAGILISRIFIRRKVQ